MGAPDPAQSAEKRAPRLWGWRHLLANKVTLEGGLWVPCQGPSALTLANNSLGDRPCCADCGGPLKRVVEPLPSDGEAQ